MMARYDAWNEWNFENGLRVWETDCDADLHSFACWDKDGVFLGTIVPASIEDMESCKADLDAGNDPVSARWEDGGGNTCTMDGWAYNIETGEIGKGEGYDNGNPELYC